MQPLEADPRVLCVAPSLIDDYWPLVSQHIEHGIVVARLDAGETVRALMRGEYLLWVIADDNHSGVRASFLTKIGEADGRKVIDVGALAGSGARDWAKALSARMAVFAREEGCVGYRFCGAPAWARLIPECRVTGQHPTGVSIYEGDAA